jgi:hypothetical protein
VRDLALTTNRNRAKLIANNSIDFGQLSLANRLIRVLFRPKDYPNRSRKIIYAGEIRQWRHMGFFQFILLVSHNILLEGNFSLVTGKTLQITGQIVISFFAKSTKQKKNVRKEKSIVLCLLIVFILILT